MKNTCVSTSRFLIGACLAALLLTVSAHAQSGQTGTWSGTYSYSILVAGCSNKTFSTTGNISVTLLQTGSSLSGRIDLTNYLIFNGNCTPANQEITGAIIGSVSGSTVGWRFPNDGSGTQFNGTTDGNSINAQISDSFGGTGTLTLTRTPGDAPAVNLTGTWSGNYSLTDRCSNNVTVSYNGAFTLGLIQSGSNAGGVVTMLNVPLYDQNCKTITTLNMVMAAAGSVSGSKFTGSVFDPSGSFDFPIQATIASGAMNASVQGPSSTSTTGTFTINQSASTAPASNFAGSYDGSYDEADNDGLFCPNIGTIQYNGAASVSIIQAGNAVSGYLTFEDSSTLFPDCSLAYSEQIYPFYGTLSGSTFTTQLPISGVSALLTVSLGDSPTGTLVDSFGDQAEFTLTSSSSTAPPAVTAFQATPSSIGLAGSTTLTWATANATTVSIDNGIGSQALSGSVSVAPTQTTTYTLTATSPSGSVTAKTTVTVLPAAPRRRSAHS